MRYFMLLARSIHSLYLFLFFFLLLTSRSMPFGDFEASQATLLLENDFSTLILEHFKLETRIVLLTDAAHEVPVIDLTRDRWHGSQCEAFLSSLSTCRSF